MSATLQPLTQFTTLIIQWSHFSRRGPITHINFPKHLCAHESFPMDTKESAGCHVEEDGEEVHSSSSTSRRNVLVYKILKQMCIVSIWFVMGLFEEIVGPTLPDLAKSINVNYEGIARALTTKSIGFFAGSLLGGFIHEIFYKHTDLIMSLGILIGAVGIGLVPKASSLSIMAFLLFLTGLSGGIINTGGNTLVFHIWGEGAASPMHSIHFGFGAGAILAPQIARPFLVEDVQPDHVLENGAVSPTNTTDLPNMGASRLDYPYGIVAVSTGCVSLLMLIFYLKAAPKGFIRRKPPALSFRTLLSPAACGRGRFSYGTIILACLFMYFLHAVGGERAYGKYIPAYCQESSLRFSKVQSANIASVFWACFVSGRFSGIFLSHWIPTSIIIIVNTIIAILTSILLVSFGYNNTTAMWILSGILGYSISLFFPCGMSWANLHLDMNSMATMIMIMGSAVGGMIYQYVPGYLFQNSGPTSLMWVMVAYGGLIALTFAIMTAITKIWGQPCHIHADTGDSGEEMQVRSQAHDVMLKQK